MIKNSIYQALSEITNLETLEQLKNDVNEAIDNRRKMLEVVNEANELKGDSFLFIKESFANLSEDLFKTKNGRKIISKYVNEHKSNKALQQLFLIYENFVAADKTINVERLINEMKDMVGEIDFEALNKGFKTLSNILKEGYIEVGEKAKTLLSEHNNRGLDKSVEYVFTNSKKLDNITYYEHCVNEIKKYIDKNDIKEMKFNVNKDINTILEEFNQTYSTDNMSEADVMIIKEIRDAENKAEVFEKYKAECLKSIDEAMNRSVEQETCNQLFEFKTRISKKVYNPDTLGLDVANFIELGKTVRE